jgi:hypothetical protein
VIARIVRVPEWDAIKAQRVLIFIEATQDGAPGPLGEGAEETLGTMVTMSAKLPLGGTEESMKAREMMDWGSVISRLACVGATAEAVPRVA